MERLLRQQGLEHEGNDENLTQEEVAAILKRYGEQQAGSSTRVSDVAEALQVDPSVVDRLLQDIRGASTEKQLRERLAQLEAEHADLRRRAEATESDVGSMFGSGHWRPYRTRYYRRSAMLAMGLAAMAAFVQVAQKNGGHIPSSTGTMMMVVAVVLGLAFVRRWR